MKLEMEKAYNDVCYITVSPDLFKAGTFGNQQEHVRDCESLWMVNP
jgi:hypothetical protein